MKQNHMLRPLIALALLCLFVAAAPPALAEALPGGVTWETTFQDMLALEGAAQDDDLFVVEGGAYTQYGFLRLGAYTDVTVYVFKGDLLVMYGGNASSSMQAAAVAFGDVYTDVLATLTETHGEPSLADPQPAMDAANTIQADAIKPDDVVSFAGWDLGGGTVLYHLHLKNAREESVVTIYVNEALLYAR